MASEKLELPKIWEKLETLRQHAQSLYREDHKKYREIIIELMRISRGEIKLKTGESIFDMEPADLAAARSCTNKQRKLCAEASVIRKRLPTSEDELEEYLIKKSKNDPKWPHGKQAAIAEVAQKLGIKAESLERYLKNKELDQFPDPIFGNDLPFISPDWHPDDWDALGELFSEGG